MRSHGQAGRVLGTEKLLRNVKHILAPTDFAPAEKVVQLCPVPVFTVRRAPTAHGEG